VFVTFKRKKLNHVGDDERELNLIIISDISTVLKYNEVQSNLDLLKALQASVSHDMRAPLSAMVQTIKVLLGKIKD
jgi:K+-sensing histidine kinase KdpD